MMKTTRGKKRVLAKISSRHGTRDLPCKFPKQIYYSKLQSKRWKKGIKHASTSQDKERQESQSQGISGLWMHPYGN